jgi:hypothetical protein
MVLGFDDAAKEFGKVMGGKAALALSGWLQELWDAEGISKKKQLDDIVVPAFEMFESIYDEYEQSFKGYRKSLLSADSEHDIHSLIDQIEGDLRFTATDRVDLLNHLKRSKNGVYDGFVRAITDFLVSSEESYEGSAEDSLEPPPPEIAVQVFRRGLIGDLRSVTNPWRAAFDPAASAPPLSEEEVKSKLDEIGQKYGIAEDDSNREGKLRARLAIERLDSRLDSMVGVYKKVREEYENLKVKLSE